jgi:hypothetical protein
MSETTPLSSALNKSRGRVLPHHSSDTYWDNRWCIELSLTLREGHALMNAIADPVEPAQGTQCVCCVHFLG